jgi:DNA-directed RNA polymerase sigma subunit (sigma70/sigma32)
MENKSMKCETNPLDHRERTILRMRNGTFVNKSGVRQPPMTLREIARYWNISHERVRQIAKDAKNKVLATL